ncbi:hypothetical protein M9Y10_005910 [Tritrichomonas musculus]|uniref:EamA domain-containing protein n=1 Tax=Tritrichomonas musculus TaxID=1915356 RepID=A0ABR2JCU4_9EUKA
MGILANVLLSVSFLGTGSLNTITNKILYQSKGVNMKGDYQYYDRPWLNTFIMFFGEFICLIIYGIISFFFHVVPPKISDQSTESDVNMSPEEKERLEQERIEREKYTFISREEVMRNPTGGLGFKYPLYILLFGACDLGATTLMGIGLTLCNASIIQIVRGFVIVFTLLMSWLFLKRKPVCHQLLGVLFAVLGLIIVGISAICNTYFGNETGSTGSKKTSPANTALGIGLTLCGQIFHATQYTLEEKLLKQDSGEVVPIPPLFLVGTEGLGGCILSSCVALPIVNAIPGSDFGSVENMKNSFYMLFHNKFILGIQVLAFCSIAFFNWCGFVYSKALSAASRTVVDCLRTIIVWIVMIICYYQTNKKYGEPISKWSILQVFGFCFMVLGTLTHNDVAGIGSKMSKPCTAKKETSSKADLDQDSKSQDQSVTDKSSEAVISHFEI